MFKKLIQTLEEERAKFDGVVQDAKRHKTKCLNPIYANKVIASASVVAYINTLLERLEKGDFN